MMSFTNIRILPESAVLTVSGGADNETGIQPKVYDLGVNQHGMSAKVGLEIPVTPSFSITPYAHQVNTQNGATGGGIEGRWTLPRPF